MVGFSRALIAIGILIAFCQSASADDSASSASIRGGAVEAVYSEPSRSQNGRFSDLRDAYFDSGTYSSKDLILRGRLDAGDGIGLDGRVVLGLTNLAADARRSYDAGDLKLSHRYIAVDMSIGSTSMPRKCLVTVGEVENFACSATKSPPGDGFRHHF